MKSKKILITKATPGMILARDIIDFSGQMLVAKDTTLTDWIISKLQFYNIHSLVIIINENEEIVKTTPDKEEEIISQDSNLNRIRNTKEFIQFQKEFFNFVEQFHRGMDEVLTHKAPLNVPGLLSTTNKLISTSRNAIHLFDMLNCMRNYDDSTYAHCLNVSLLCNIFGQWIHLPPDELEVLTLSGLFHDIGKLEIPQSIIMKPAKLTDSEYRLMQKHPTLGYELLKDMNIDNRIKNAALMHHERLDGTGYPQKLKGPQIDELAKIVAIADVYDALTSKRIYRDPLCPFEVLHIFEEEGYTKYDPSYLIVFFNQIFQTYVLNTVRLNDGSEGKIIMINKDALGSPVVQIGDRFIDLSKNKSLFIQAII
ncbi:HD-GYP domain-containing protein [Anaerosporobacter sp.]